MRIPEINEVRRNQEAYGESDFAVINTEKNE